MSKAEIIGELMSVYQAGKPSMSREEARTKAEAKFEQSKVYYKKCGYLTEAKK